MQHFVIKGCIFVFYTSKKVSNTQQHIGYLNFYILFI